MNKKKYMIPTVKVAAMRHRRLLMESGTGEGGQCSRRFDYSDFEED